MRYNSVGMLINKILVRLLLSTAPQRMKSVVACFASFLPNMYLQFSAGPELRAEGYRLSVRESRAPSGGGVVVTRADIGAKTTGLILVIVHRRELCIIVGRNILGVCYYC